MVTVTVRGNDSRPHHHRIPALKKVRLLLTGCELLVRNDDTDKPGPIECGVLRMEKDMEAKMLWGMI